MEQGARGEPALRFRNIAKRFGATQALNGVSFDVAAGSIHAVLGQNGAGKTTLMKILMGIYRQDAGEILRDGRSVTYSGPKRALEAGVGMVFQNSTLIRSLTVAENLALGRVGPAAGGVAPKNAQTLVEDLSRAERQLIELQRLLDRSAEIIILDEPTSALTPLEAEALFGRLQALKTGGKTVLVVTHKLREVEAHADSVTVLRDGRLAATGRTADFSIPQLASLMVGEMDGVASRPIASNVRQPSDVVLKVSGISLRSDTGPAASKLSFELHRGECIGVAGVAGNGQRELIEALTRGETPNVLILGKPLARASRRDFAYVPDNARDLAVANALSVRDNVMLNSIAWPAAQSAFWQDDEAYASEARARLDRFSVKYRDLRDEVSSLSGGNIHKLILAREFSSSPALAIVVNPTAGLDIRTIHDIRVHLRRVKEEGCALLLVSNELDEILELADRILVLADRKAVGDLMRQDANLGRLGQLMGGHVGAGHST